MVGPTFKGLYGRQEEVMSDGDVRVVTMDEERIRVAIREPARDVVRGYPPQMPTIAMGPDELNQVVAYLKELK